MGIKGFNRQHQISDAVGLETKAPVAQQVLDAMETQGLASADLLQDAKMRRFRKDRYALYIYGVCSVCQLKEKRKRVAIKNENKK